MKTHTCPVCREEVTEHEFSRMNKAEKAIFEKTGVCTACQCEQDMTLESVTADENKALIDEVANLNPYYDRQQYRVVLDVLGPQPLRRLLQDLKAFDELFMKAHAKKYGADPMGDIARANE